MIAKILQSLERSTYKRPDIAEDIPAKGHFGQYKIALVTDPITTASLAAECRIKSLTPKNYKNVLDNWKPDLVFVESAFRGIQSEWHYELAKQPIYIRQLPQTNIRRLIQHAKDKKIPTVFWNKDDQPFFEAFIDVAKLFDYVFTTDCNYLSKYQDSVPSSSKVHVVAMPYQPAFHHFNGFNFESNDACFVGSYYKRVFGQRKSMMDHIFNACEKSSMPLHIYDRQKKDIFHFSHFRFPEKACAIVHGPVPYAQTGTVYKRHAVSFNTNSVTDSDTMISRRLLEILACGGVLITNPSKAVDKYFKDYCYCLNNEEETTELLLRLKHGLSNDDKERAAAGAAYVQANHTWECRLKQITDIIKN